MYPNNDIIRIGPWIGESLTGYLYYRTMRHRWMKMPTILPAQISAIYSPHFIVTDKTPETTFMSIIKLATIELIGKIS
jgi:hypothetical protein